MQLEDALKLIKRLISTGEKHKDYKRTTDLADDYKVFITGAGIDLKLKQVVQREDEALFKQRVALTKSITPAVASSIRQPFNKVTRNDRIRKTVKLENEGRQKLVLDMIAKFYGSARKKNRGLDYWLKTRFVEMQFIDPNSWVVVEWDTPEDEAQAIIPRPFEVPAVQAHNFFIDNDEVRWLFVCQPIKYMTFDAAAVNSNTGVPQLPTPGEPIKKDGERFTLYDEDFTIVYEQIDEAYFKSIGYVLGPNEAFETMKDKRYIVRSYKPNIGYAPAFRIGYKRDEETSGRTFVNPWHDGLCFFEKSLKTVSELDLTMTLHAFPQKLQYVQKCKGLPPASGEARGKGCSNGFEQGTQNLCKACKGMGYKLHTTAQDAILLPMPDSKEDMIDLNNILVYKAPPTDLVKLQNEYVLQLERQAHQAVFNSQVFVKKAGGGITETTTATESEFNMQSVYDALEPFTEKLSEMWREFVIIFGRLTGEELEKIEASHDFPADYKLKTSDLLLVERKTASESGAPPFFIETLDDDLAAITYQGDELGLLKYKVKRRYFPFTGKNEDEVAVLLSSEHVPRAPKVLYSNFELIFKDIESQNVNFYTMPDMKKQREIVDNMVKQWMENLDKETPKQVAPMFGPDNVNAGDGGTADTPGDDNPGGSDNQDNNQGAE